MDHRAGMGRVLQARKEVGTGCAIKPQKLSRASPSACKGSAAIPPCSLTPLLGPFPSIISFSIHSGLDPSSQRDKTSHPRHRASHPIPCKGDWFMCLFTGAVRDLALLGRLSLYSRRPISKADSSVQFWLFPCHQTLSSPPWTAKPFWDGC